MKKLLSFGLILTLFIYLTPVIMQKYGIDNEIKGDISPVYQNVNEDDEIITVMVDGKNEQMPLEEYIMGVVCAEISPDFPEEAIKAQAVAARTYAVYKMQSGASDEHPDANVCNDYTHCAAYTPLTVKAASWGDNADTYTSAVQKAVEDTRGQIVTYGGEPIVAVFSAASTDKTEAAIDVWGSDVPYLVSVDSYGGEACPKYKADVTFSAAEFREMVQKALPSADVTGEPNTWFKASIRSAAGGIIRMKLGGIDVSGTDVRELFGLNSTNFTISTDENSITFHTVGYGHGVGLSQYGAKYMAEQGKTYTEILSHYYQGTEIATLDTLS